MRVELVSMKPNQKIVKAAVIYRHPFNNALDFILELESFPTKISNEQVDFYYVGDINLDLNNSAGAVKKYEQLLSRYGLTN